MNLPAKVFACEAVRGLMDESQEEHQYPELRQFEEALPGEVEKKCGIRTYKAPVCNKDGSLKDEEKDDGEYAPSAINKVANGSVQANRDNDRDPKPRN